VGKISGAGGSIILSRIPVKGISSRSSGRDSEGILFGMMQKDEDAG
jgi:predicted enzyme related to lactoylglutathione lyase